MYGNFFLPSAGAHSPGAGHFGHKTLRHRDTSEPQNWCRSLRRITGGAVSHRNCLGSKCPGFSSITALVSKCLVPRFWCRSVLRSVPKCPTVSWCRRVLWPKCPVTHMLRLRSRLEGSAQYVTCHCIHTKRREVQAQTSRHTIGIGCSCA